MKLLEIFRKFSTFIGIFLLLMRKTHGKNYPYKKCRPFVGTKLQLWLQGGKCIAASRCELLEGCTTFHGSIIIRPTYNVKAIPIKFASFPALREVTGFLIILFFKEFKSMNNLFPNLAVIRGTSQILHYSLIIYQTLLERVILPSLTVIKSGGVRIDQNDQMCYIKTISWGSIVLDKGLTEENFGLTFYKNNENCYDKCLTGSCYAPSGHGSARQQHCFGPGNRLKDNPQCQKLCKASCGVRGCLEGTMDQCCHEECLGGCTVKGSNRHCHACMHYRSGPYGFCVSKCPDGMYVVGNFECRQKCPNDHLWFLAVKSRQYRYKGHCVRRCPAGYIGDSFKKECVQCKTDRCPRECGTVGRVYKIDGLHRANELKGCTVVIGDIKIEIRAGPNDMVEKLEKILGSIETVHGYIEVRESKVLTSLSFFRSLREIRPFGLLQNDLALLVFRNSNLKTLWNPKTLSVTKGRLLFHSNAYLCPNEIKSFEKTLLGSKSKAVTETKNGYLGECDLKKFNITVTEITDPKLCDPSANKKCVEVTWNHLRSLDPRNVFYIINYRIISKDTKKVEKKEDSCGAIKWNQIDVNVPRIEVNSNQTSVKKVVLMKNKVMNLKPYALYAFFVETYVLDGEVRKSGIVEIRLSEAAPGRPLGLQAAFLSKSEIQVTWSPPDDPNGVITQYRIFYKPKEYSFWHSKLDWCSRDVTGQSSTDALETSGKNSSSLGFCRRNVTCDCGPKTKVSRTVREDRNFAIFNRNLQDAIIFRLFSKKEDDSGKNESSSKKGTMKTGPVCDEEAIKKGKCKKPSEDIKTTAPQTGKIQIQETTTTSSVETPALPTLRPVENYIKVSGNTFKYVIKNLQYFREYRIMVCPCTKAGCLGQPQPMCNGTVGRTDANSSAVNNKESLRRRVCPCNKVECREVVCASTVGQTDADPYADSIPERVMVNVKDNAYNVSWIAPPKPNGIVLRYDIRTRLNQNEERLRCRLGNLPTTLIEVGAAPGNYSIRIRAITPASNGSTWTPYTYFNIEEKVAAASPTSNKIVIGIGSGAAFLIILLLITIVYYIHVRKTAQMGVPGLLYASVNPEYLNSNEVYIPDEWEVPRDKIELIKELGKGSFGMVYEGIAYDIIEDEPKLRVAVKTVNENASIRDRSEFLQEASIMKAFNCNHIVRLLGVVSQEQPTLVVMELMERGDLKTFLRSRRPEERGGLSPPNLAETLQMAAEIADGMSYLAARKFVHRDLAARNCMVAADFTVKIGDFGMTRDVYETDYYRKGGKGLLPVRWMAPESLRDGIFTTASDVWSYGVVLWEMATLAAQPYPGKSNEDVLRFVVEGGVLEQPDDCSDRLYNMMCNCWKTDPRARPSFLEIVQFLENDVSDAFEEVSYYHEMKRKLLEATETTLLKGPDTLNVNVNQVRQGSLKMNNLIEPNHRGSLSSASGAEDNWKTEADRSMQNGAEKPDGRSKSMYDNDGDAANVRYVELPQSNTKSKKKDGKPVPV